MSMSTTGSSNVDTTTLNDGDTGTPQRDTTSAGNTIDPTLV